MSDKAFILLKLSIGRHPRVNVELPFDLLSEICWHYYEQNTAISHIVGTSLKSEPENPSNAIYISDIYSNDEYLSLLLVRGDPGRPVPGFVNPDLRSVKSADAEEPGYVPGCSSHLVISKKKILDAKNSGFYRAAIEKTRGISRILVRDFLTQLMARFSAEYPERFTAEKKRKNKKEKLEEIVYRPTVRFSAQPNGSLKKDLEEGRIGGFKLTRGTTQFNGEADEPNIQRINVQLQARISPTENISRVKKLVNHIQQDLEKISFEALNLELVDENGDPINNTQSIEIDKFGDSDLKYCKMISIPPKYASDNECNSKIYKNTIDYGLITLNKEENWK